MRRRLLSLLLGIGSSALSFAQTAAPPNAVRLTKYILGVADLDKSVAFYRALGIELDGKISQPQPLPDFLLKLVDVPKGTQFRNAMMKIPGADFALELTEFTGMELHPGRPRAQDPGASVLILTVRDLDAALAAAKKAGATIGSTDGSPVRLGTDPAILVRDPDGFGVGLRRQESVPATAPATNVVAARFNFIVGDAEKAANFYRSKFGFDASLEPWDSREQRLKFNGTPGAQVRQARAVIPGTKLAWSFVELKGIDRKPYTLRIPDPGAPAVGLQVRDLDAAAGVFKSAGGSVITQGGGIQLPSGDKLAFMRDPSGILVEVAQPAAKK